MAGKKLIQPGLAVVAACSLAFSVGTFTVRATSGKMLPANVSQVCSKPAAAHKMQCLALSRTDAQGGGSSPLGLHPADLQSAYNLPSQASGEGATVAVIDAYDDPTAEKDLTTYRNTFGLPLCATAGGCLRKVNQRGESTNLPSPNSHWAGETSLDLDMVSATCPKCKLLLVEADSDDDAEMLASVNTAVKLGAKFISNSYGDNEPANAAAFDQQYLNHPGVTITVSSGDSGFGASYPATSSYVTAVGGTTLNRANRLPRKWSESAWSDSGSGCSDSLPKTLWQPATVACAQRAESDVSAVADPETGVSVYDSYLSDGWKIDGGTSVSAPIIAGVYALAGTPGPQDYPSLYPYAHPTAFNDITTGSNGSCPIAVLCNAGLGWDGPTGLGTPNGIAGFQAPKA